MNNSSSKVFLMGATGFTGQLIAFELLRRSIKFIPVVRSLNSWSEIASKIGGEFLNPLSFNDFSRLDSETSDFDILINAVGPFEKLSKTFIPKLLATKKLRYLDITGEIHFVKWLFEESKNWKSQIVPSCAFESYLSDFILETIVQNSGATSFESLDTFYKTTPPRPSPGTRLTMEASRNNSVLTWAEGDWSTSQDSKSRFHLTSNDNILEPAESILAPYPEIIFWTQRYNTQNCRTSYFGPPHMIQGLLASRRVDVSSSEAPKKLRKEDPFSDRWKKIKFEIIVRAELRGAADISMRLSGDAPYGLTAYIAASAAEQFLRQSTEDFKAGASSPAQVFSMKEFEEMLAENSLTFETIELNQGPSKLQ